MTTRSKRSKESKAGKFLPPSGGASPEGRKKQLPSTRRPFVADNDTDRKVAAERGMAAEALSPEKGMFINFDIHEHLQDLQEGEQERMGDLVQRVVKATVEAAIPAIIKAVKEVCIAAVKEEVNPHLLRLQYKTDQLEQLSRRDNLRITGITEEESEEELEELLASKICKVAEQAGVDLKGVDISSCNRLGRKSAGKPRQAFVRLTNRKQRDRFYDSRFKLKGKDRCQGVFVNEDLTPLRYALLRAAKSSALVKRVSTKNGNIVCKMTNDEYVTMSSPDDLFEVGVDNINYKDFKLHFME